LRLIRAGDVSEEDITHRSSGNQSKDENSKFDYFEYCKKRGFDVQNELAKEKNIKDFFLQKYRIQSFSLGDHIMRKFLSTNSEMKKQSVTEYKESNNNELDYNGTTLIVLPLTYS